MLHRYDVHFKHGNGFLKGKDPSEDLIGRFGHGLLKQDAEDRLDDGQVTDELANDGEQGVVKDQHLERNLGAVNWKVFLR